MAAPQLVVRVAANMAELKKNLAEGVNQIEITKGALVKMAAGYDGTRIIQQAGATAAAIQQMGGVTRLTAGEQAKANAILEQALEKYRALGREAPPGMQALADATKRVGPPLTQTNDLMGQIWGGLRSAAGLVGIAFSAGAVVNFASRVFAAAGEINDMSLKLGISAEATQRFTFAAEQTGATMETVGRSIVFMNKTLAGGDASTKETLRSLGLEFSAVRAMRSEDAFMAIGEAIARLPDPMRQTQASFELLGKTGTELLPAFKSNFRELADSVNVMSDGTVAALDRAEDAWGRLGNSVVRWSGTMIATSLHTVDQATSSWAGFAQFAENVVKHGIGVAMSLADAAAVSAAASVKKLGESSRQAGDDAESLADRLREQAQAKSEAESAAKRLKDAQEELRSAGDGWRGTLEGINDAVRVSVRWGLEAGVSQSALATVYGLTATQVKAVATSLEEEKKAHEESERAAKKAAETKARGLAELAQLQALYAESVARNSLSTTSIEIAGNERVLAAIVARLAKAGVAEEEYRALVQQVSAEMTRGVMVDVDALRAYSRTALDEKAAKAEATYRAALAASGQFSAGAIQHFRDLAENARLAALDWSMSFEKAGDRTVAKMAAVAQACRTYTEEMLASVSQIQQLTDVEVQQMGGEAALRRKLEEIEAYYRKYPGARSGGSGLTGVSPSDEAGYRQLLQMQVLYEQIKQFLASIGRRAAGGPVASGAPYVVGERGPELFVPERSGSIVPHGVAGGMVITNHITINGSVLGNRYEIARVVGDVVGEAVMDRMRRQGVRMGSA